MWSRGTVASPRVTQQQPPPAGGRMTEDAAVRDAPEPWTRLLPSPIRPSAERLFPRGAVVRSLLTLTYFVMGQPRNRVFANTYGTGTELDAYYAAFRVPELALDVLVAAGLTAPFVPIF